MTPDTGTRSGLEDRIRDGAFRKPVATFRAGSPARRFRDDESGAYAIEFALFGTLTLIVMMVLFQFGIVHLARQNLNTALQVATRSLLTGTFQKANAAAANQATILSNMRTLMCGSGSASPAVFYSCDNLKVEVQVARSFDSSDWNRPAVDRNTGTWTNGFGTTAACPSAESIAVVRAAVKIPIVIPLFKLGLNGFSDGSAAVQAASVFRVEPYQSGNTAACW